jgi:hypothetical protein
MGHASADLAHNLLLLLRPKANPPPQGLEREIASQGRQDALLVEQLVQGPAAHGLHSAAEFIVKVGKGQHQGGQKEGIESRRSCPSLSHHH